MPKCYSISRQTHTPSGIFISLFDYCKKFNHTLFMRTVLQSIHQHTPTQFGVHRLAVLPWTFNDSCWENSSVYHPLWSPQSCPTPLWSPQSCQTLPTSSLFPSLAAFCHLHVCRCMTRSLCLKWRSSVLPFMQHKSSAGLNKRATL